MGSAHSPTMGSSSVPLPGRQLVAESVDDGRTDAIPPLDRLYDLHADYVFRVLRRLGVDAAHVEDAVQDVFMVVLSRAESFEGRSSLRTWLYGIALRVARAHRRRRQTEPLEDASLDGDARGPARETEHAEELRLLGALLAELEEPFREAFVLAEIEQLTAPEIAEVTGVKLNTVYSRIRLGRQRFEAALRRHRAREAGRSR